MHWRYGCNLLTSEGTAAVERQKNHVSRFVGAKRNRESDLIRYGIREAIKRPTAAHRRDKPEPLETSMPRGIFVVLRISPFTDSDVLMAVVQSAAAVRVNKVARIARHADARKASVCL
jgi:hypothetical protein